MHRAILAPVFSPAVMRALCLVPLLLQAVPVQPAYAANQPFAGAMETASPAGLTGASPTSVTSGAGAAEAPAAVTATPTPDYAHAAWVSASSSNYSVANRAHDYPIDMIVIHDIEGSYGSAIRTFQDPSRKASAHYIVSYTGQIAQMVLEKNIAWHAGNWDYNTRAIGIEHEGFAWTPHLYTHAEYIASAHLIASICSRWGVPMDRLHVIGHNQVPDPYNPGLLGGSDHHTDPGPYWDWKYYIGVAKSFAALLPSPPHMMPDPVAVNGLTSATVTWKPARTCHLPISGYKVVAQPGGMTVNVPASGPLSATFTGLQIGQAYKFSVTATNSDGSDIADSNTVIAGACTAVSDTANPGSPQLSGTEVAISATASVCPNPEFEFWVLAPGATLYTLGQGYSPSPVFHWDTSGLVAGTYRITVWSRDHSSAGESGNGSGRWDAYNAKLLFTVTSLACTAVSEVASPASAAMVGTTAKITAIASGCPNPLYEFWIKAPGASLYTLAHTYSTSAVWSWNTAGLTKGTYRINVWVRDNSSSGTFGNSSGRWDAYNANLTYTLTAGCPAVKYTTSPPSAAAAGTTVTVTAGATGCPNPFYEFWILAPGAKLYKLEQGYSTNPAYTWHTTGLAKGTYRITVWVRDNSSSGIFHNSSGRWDAYSSTLYRLT